MVFAPAKFIPVPPAHKNVRFDHADIYNPTARESRLYVACTGADRVDVIDCLSRTYLRSLPDHPGVAGVLVHSEQDLLLTSDRGCARLSVYRCSDEARLGTVEVGPRPNGIAYDPARRRVFTFNLGEPIGENCTASVASLDEMRTMKTMPLPGRPRWAVYDQERDRVYANIREPAQIAVIDADRLEITAAWDVPAAGPHGLVLAGNRLFCAADGGTLVAMDADDGTVVETADLPGEPDVVMHDAHGSRLFVAVGDPGVIVVIDEASLHVIGTVETETGAHSFAWDPSTRTLFAFLPERGGALALKERAS